MITKQHFIESLCAEIDIIRHLGTKVDESMLSYRPSEKQRTLLELMNYLGHIFSTGVAVNIEGNTNRYMEIAQSAPTVTLENFDTVMKEQSDYVSENVSKLTDEQLAEVTDFFGGKAPRSIHMLNVMKWAVAYKMQLFLYIKANGNHDISTSNLWRGVDMAPKQ